MLDLRTEAAHIHLRHVGDDDDTMRVADVHRRHGEALPVDLDRVELVDVRLAHVDCDLAYASGFALEEAGHPSAERVQREAFFRRVAMFAEELREDSHAVPALLGLAAVGIQDADAEVCAVAR